jgi:hypothetical protein
MTKSNTEKTQISDSEQLFWSLAQPLLHQEAVVRSTMMGLPCLRVGGAFFASYDRKTGDLLVKLPAPRVDELVSAGRATCFAPAGRPFREWAAVSAARSRSWNRLLQEAIAFVGGQS